MTRELSPKAGAALLRSTFAAKGAQLTHTEALDLLAKLKGYNAWSHMQQDLSNSSSVAPVQAPTAAPAPKVREPLSDLHIALPEVLSQHYGIDGELALFPRAVWQKEGSNRPYWDWVETRIDDGDWSWGSKPFNFKRNNLVKVTLPDGTISSWNIEQNLTSRCGELNSYLVETKPGLALLTLDESLLEKLRSEMYDEITFLARKDGEFGLYYEMEFASIESEADNRDEGDEQDLKPHAEVVAHLLDGIRKLQVQFPTVQFCVPDESHIINDRPAVWAYVKSGTLSDAEREALGAALFNL